MMTRTIVSNKLVFRGSLGDDLVARVDSPENQNCNQPLLCKLTVN